MRDASAQDRYLEEVAARLRLPDAVRDEVIEELAAHLADATDEGVAHGLPFEVAERGALERLGPPDALADRLRRTHQTTRELLSAVGGSLVPAVRDAVGGYVVGMALILGAAAMTGGLGWVALLVLDLPVPAWTQDRRVFDAVSILVAWSAAWWGTGTLVRTAATKAFRQPEEVWLLVGVVVALVTAAIAVTVRLPHNLVSVILLAVLPVVTLVSAYAAGHPCGTIAARLPLSRRTASAIAFGFVVLFCGVLVGGAIVSGSITLPSLRVEHPVGDPDASVVAGERRARETWPVEVLGARSRGEPVVVEIDVRALATDARGVTRLRLEAWHAVGTGGMIGVDGAVDPAFTAPFAVVDLPEAIDRRVQMDLSGTRNAGPYVLFLVGIDEVSGQRVIIGEPHLDDTTFYGTLVDWLIAPD